MTSVGKQKVKSKFDGIEFEDLMKQLEDHYTKEIFELRNDKTIRSNLKLTKLESIMNSALAFKLPMVVELASNAIHRILGD